MRTLIVTEGTRTEPEYFLGLVAYLRATATDVRRAPSASVTGVGPGPLRALNRAVELRDAESKKGRPFDQVWIVFDVDTHTGVPETLRAAQRENVRVAITNPCFELWLLLHFEDCRAHCDAETLKRRLVRLGVVGKGMPDKFEYNYYRIAVKRLATELTIDGIPTNPGETVSLLVETLEP